MDLKESLQEIAELLLLIHESYIQGLDDRGDLLFNLFGILQGLKLLGNTVSVIDAEASFRQQFSNGSMDYGNFYGWLRSISAIAFPSVVTTEGTNVALQKLLSDRIIPLASAGFPDVVALRNAVVMPSPVFDVFIAYDSFFKLLFAVSAGLNASTKLSAIEMLWHHLICVDGKISITQVQGILRISSPKVSRDAIRGCCLTSLKSFSSPDSDDEDEEQDQPESETVDCEPHISGRATAVESADLTARGLDMSEFCLCMHLICKQVSVSSSDGDGHAGCLPGLDEGEAPVPEHNESDSGSYRPACGVVLLNAVGAIAEHHCRKIITDICRSLVDSGGHKREIYKIPSADIMFLCRLGGLVRHCFVGDGSTEETKAGGGAQKLSIDDLAQLIDVLNWNFKAADLAYPSGASSSPKASPSSSPSRAGSCPTHKIGGSPVVADHFVERFLLNMCQVVETLSGVPYSAVVTPYAAIGNEHRSISSRCSLYLAKTAPALLLGFNIYTLRAGSLSAACGPEGSAWTLPGPTGASLHLHDLYSKEGLRCISCDFVPMLHRVVMTDQVSVGAKQTALVTLSGLLRLCEKKFIVPVLLDRLVWARVCSSFFGFSDETYASAMDISFPLDGAAELLFLMAQLCFNNSDDKDTDAVAADSTLAKRTLMDGVGDNPVERFRRLLGFFVDPSPLVKQMTEATFLSSEAPIEYAASALLHHGRSGTVDRSELPPEALQVAESRKSVVISPLSDWAYEGNAAVAVDAGPSLSSHTLTAVTKYTLEQDVASFNEQLAPHLNPTGSSRQEIMMIMLHFPINNFQFNPWALHDLILTKDADDVNIELSEVLRDVCGTFAVSFERLLDYISGMFELEAGEGTGENVVMKQVVSNSLAADSVKILTTPAILKLLGANEELLHWEFLRCCSYRRVDDFPSVVSPLPFGYKLQYSDSSFPDTVVTRSAAIAWAEEVTSSSNWNITKEISSSLFDECCQIPICSETFPGMKTGNCEKYLPFSLFVLFSVKLFTRYITTSMADVKRDETMNEVLQKAFSDACGAMLHVFSERLSGVQQVMKARLLSHLLRVPNIEFEWRDQLNNTVDALGEYELKEFMNSMYAYSVDAYAVFCQLHITATQTQTDKRKSILPPFPYNKFWDVCRFVSYCKFIGLYTKPSAVTLLSLTLSDLWQVYAIFQLVLKDLLRQQRAGNAQIPVARLAIDRLITGTIRSVMGYDDSIGSGSSLPRDVVVSPKPIRIDTDNGVLDPDCPEPSAGPRSTPNYTWFDIMMRCVGEFLVERLRDHELRHGVGVLVNSNGEESWVGEREDHLDANTARKTIELKHEVKLSVLTQIVAYTNRTLEKHNADRRATGDSGNSVGPTLGNLAKIGYQMRPHCCELEELLRYGGQSLMHTLRYFRAFIRCTYDYLIQASRCEVRSPSDSSVERAEPSSMLLEEPALSEVCSFLSAGSALWTETDSDGASMLGAVTRTLHVRSRPLLHKRRSFKSDGASRFETIVDSSILTVSLQEFEELVLVCGLELHLRAGGKHSTKPESTVAGSARVGRASPWKAGTTDAAQAVLDSYCMHANGRAMTHFKLPQQGSAAGDMPAPFIWGVDFVWPYLCVLKDHFIHLYRQAPFDLSAIDNLGSSFESPVFTPVGEEFYLRFRPIDPLTLTLPPPAPVTKSPVPVPQSSREPEMTSPWSSHGSSSPQSQAGTSVTSMVGSTATSTAGSVTVNSMERRRQLQEKANIVNSQRRGNTKQLVETIDNIVDGSKEALWPLFVTYCSCGDSFDPGKLSGPNAFALLSKLDLLNERTLFSDISILMHQISAHTISEVPFKLDVILANAAGPGFASGRGSPSTISSSSEAGSEAKGIALESPALTFEEFLVFLCAYSQLFYDGKLDVPTAAPPLKSLDIVEQREHQEWFEKWQIVMNSSSTFKRLISEKVFPPLLRDKSAPVSLLACPSEARIRDKYVSLFTLDVVLAIEGAEEDIRQLSRTASAAVGGPRAMVVQAQLVLDALKRLELVPGVIEESTITFTLSDVLPETTGSTKGPVTNSVLAFPQWEWVLCVAAFHSVEYAINKSPLTITKFNPKKIPALVADVFKTVATTMFELDSAQKASSGVGST